MIVLIEGTGCDNKVKLDASDVSAGYLDDKLEESTVFSTKVGETFETVSKNLNAYSSTLNYTGDDLTSIVYTKDSETIIKTLNYIGDDLTSIILSGDTPSGIDLTKTLSYVGDNLTNITYT